MARLPARAAMAGGQPGPEEDGAASHLLFPFAVALRVCQGPVVSSEPALR